MKTALTMIAALALTAGAQADIRITEWMYNGALGEFVELTNVGSSAIDMTGWSFDDDSATPGVFDLSGFGIVAPGQTVVISEQTATDFRAEWGLPGSIAVLGGNTANLGHTDQINIFNGSTLVDRLTYSDQNIAGSIRTQNRSGVPTTLSALGADNVLLWQFADLMPGGGVYDLTGIAGATGVLTSSLGDTGNPGYFVPTPGSMALALVGVIAAGRRRR